MLWRWISDQDEVMDCVEIWFGNFEMRGIPMDGLDLFVVFV